MTRKDRDHYTLSTGREIDANHGLISCAPDLNQYADAPYAGFEIGEGYDGHLFDLAEWTPDEHAELADFMIEQWQAFKAAACTAAGHTWSQWVYGTAFGSNPPERSKVRNCHRCGASECVDVTEKEFQQS